MADRQTRGGAHRVVVRLCLSGGGRTVQAGDQTRHEGCRGGDTTRVHVDSCLEKHRVGFHVFR